MSEYTDEEASIISALTGEIRCPDYERWLDDLKGCGSLDVRGPDRGGYYICANCALVFHPAMKPEGEYRIPSDRWRVTSAEHLYQLRKRYGHLLPKK